jgi:hypothetical protein
LNFPIHETQDLLSAVRKASDEEGEKRVALTLARRLITQNKHAEAIQVIESVKSIQVRHHLGGQTVLTIASFP